MVNLSFFRLHQYYVKEISRGCAGLGNYNLRPQYISAKRSVRDSSVCCLPATGHSECYQRKPVHRHPVQEESKKADDPPEVKIHMSGADELMKIDRIVFSPKLGTFHSQGHGRSTKSGNSLQKNVHVP